MGLERAAWLQRRYGARIVWRPFDLHPEYPAQGIARAELVRRYGEAFEERQNAMFDAAGLPHARTRLRVPNSRGALIVGELARERGVFDVLHPRLFEAYWARGRDIGDHQVLVEEGTAASLEESEILEVLRERRYLEDIEAYTRAVLELGAGGVPAWLIDERLLVPGAQPHEVFERVLERLGHRPRRPGDGRG